MARILALICSIFLVVSCGQIGTISGGPKDEIAPQITSSNLTDKQLNFSEKVIEFTFDEYIDLNKASEQIVLVPADSKLQSKLTKKTLSISLEDSLQKNTTYTLYLNAAVKDVTEGNDSLMKFTFSTGKVIDSLSLHVRMFDAFSKEWNSKVTVGLYPNFEDESPRYFTQSQSNGVAHFEALRPGRYFVKAFTDKNQDLRIQQSEIQGYNWDAITLDSEFTDTILLPISLPIQVDKVKNARLIPPGIIGVHVPTDFDRSNIQLNGQTRDINQYIGRGEDSLLISIGEVKEIDLKLIIAGDTILLRNTPKQQAAKVTTQLIDKEGKQDRFFLTCSDFIQWLDTSKITLRDLADSSLVAFDVEFLANEFQIRPKKFAKNYQLSLADGAILGKTKNVSSKFQKEIEWKQDRDFGDLTIQLSDTVSAGIVQILQKNQVIRTVLFNEIDKINLPDLVPGEYTFKVIFDRNKNGKWDPILPNTKTLAEEVLLFNTPVKIRANWEVEVNFDLHSNQP
ncbi:MAG: hypothetical protein RLZZ585_1045 [Bacteroidota bacterium]|jgi:hypothetical protein